MDVVRQLRYQHALNRAFSEFFIEMPWKALKENHETSHHNLADTFMHMVNMEDWYLHTVLAGNAWDGPAYDGFTSAEAMRERVLEVEKKAEAYVATLKPGDLDREVQPGELDLDRPVRLGDFLSEVVMELTHHRGELLGILWRMDREPPDVSYLEWVSGPSP